VATYGANLRRSGIIKSCFLSIKNLKIVLVRGRDRILPFVDRTEFVRATLHLPFFGSIQDEGLGLRNQHCPESLSCSSPNALTVLTEDTILKRFSPSLRGCDPYSILDTRSLGTLCRRHPRRPPPPHPRHGRLWQSWSGSPNRP
jgi:hypothetical protein